MSWHDFYEVTHIQATFSMTDLPLKITFLNIMMSVLISDAVDGQQYVLFNSHDVTAEKEATKSLKESEEKYRNLFENSADGIVILDENNNVLELNRRFCDMLGLDMFGSD